MNSRPPLYNDKNNFSKNAVSSKALVSDEELEEGEIREVFPISLNREKNINSQAPRKNISNHSSLNKELYSKKSHCKDDISYSKKRHFEESYNKTLSDKNKTSWHSSDYRVEKRQRTNFDSSSSHRITSNNSNAEHKDQIALQNQSQLIEDLTKQHKTISIFAYGKYLNLLSKCKRYTEAMACYKKLKQERQINAVIDNIMIKVYAKLERFDEAINIYLQLVRLGEANVVSHTAAISVYVASRRFDEAINIYLKLVRQGEADVVSHNTMIKIYAELERFDEAINIYLQLVRQGEADIVSHNTIIKVYAELKRFNEAINLYLQLIKQGKANVFIHTPMIKVYAALGRVDEAINIYLELVRQNGANVVSHNTMIKVYADLKRFDEAINIYLQLVRRGESDVVSHNTIIRVYAESGRFEDAINIYLQLKRQGEADVISHTTILKIYGQLGKIEAAEEIYNLLQKEKKADLISHMTILSVYANHQKIEKCLTIFKGIPDGDKTIFTRAKFSQILIKNFNFYHLNLLLSELNQIQAKITSLSHKHPDYHLALSKFIDLKHKVIEKIEINAKNKKRAPYQHTLTELKEDMLLLCQALITYFNEYDPEYITITLLEARLLNTYLPELEFLPKHIPLTQNELATIKDKAKQNLSHPLMPLSQDKERYKILEVNAFGKVTGHHFLNHSILHEMLAVNKNGYAVMKFDRILKPSKLPMFTKIKDEDTQKNTVYITTVIGSTQRVNANKSEFGTLTCLPIQYARYINKQFFTFNESAAYGQRALRPEAPDGDNKGMTGIMRVGIIPDVLKYQVLSPFIVQDGCGYIKASLAINLMGLMPPKPVDHYPVSYLTYQATQTYGADEFPEVVEEWVQHFSPVVQTMRDKLSKGEKLSSLEINQFAAAMTGGLPTYMPTIIPVAGNKLVLPDTIFFREIAQMGIAVGRNPYSSPNLQAIWENIEFSNALSVMIAIQYTLIGFQIDQLNSPSCFFKGLLVLIDDILWPSAFANCDLLVSAKDQKMNENWLHADARALSQNPGESSCVEIAGSLVVKKMINKLAGLPVTVAKNLAADYDGDEVNFMPFTFFPATKEMIYRKSKEHIPNVKLPKTFTPRTQMGNWHKLIDSRFPLLEKWTTVSNIFYSLTAVERQEFIATMVEEHIFSSLLGETWKSQLGVQSETIDDQIIIICEIQLGIKCGEDGPKTTIPMALMVERLKDYEKALRKYNPQLSVSYGKGFKNKLINLAANDQTYANVSKILQPLQTSAINNVVGKSQQQLALLFFKTSCNDNNQNNNASSFKKRPRDGKF